MECERPALGAMAHLGWLYDASVDKFCGHSMFKTNSLPPSAVTVTQMPLTNIEFSHHETLNEKFNRFKMAADLKVSFLAGLLPVSVFGEYFDDCKSTSRACQVTAICGMTTVVEHLNLFGDELTSLVSDDALSHVSASHVVVGIEWGGNVFMSATYTDSDSSTKHGVDGSIKQDFDGVAKALISRMNVALTTAGGQADYGNTVTLKENNFRFKLHGDLLPVDERGNDAMPVTLEVACRQFRQMQSAMQQANNGRGKPIRYTLFPLFDASFMKRFGDRAALTRLLRPVDETAVLRFVELFDQISATRQRVNDLLADTRDIEYCLPDDTQRQVRRLLTDLNSGEATLRKQLADLLQQVRLTTREMCELEQLSLQYLNQEDAAPQIETRYKGHRRVVQRKMELARTLRKYNVIYVKGDEPFESFLVDNDEVYVMFASDALVTENSEQWKINRFAFFNLAGSRSSTSSGSVFLYVDCTFDEQLLTREGLLIKHYRNSRCVCDDVAQREHVYSSKNIARSSVPLKLIPETPPRHSTVVELRCPLSLSGSCGNARRQWVCWKCQQTLVYSLDDDMVHCQCGRGSLGAFTFRCNDSDHHGLAQYAALDEDSVKQFVRQQRHTTVDVSTTNASLARGSQDEHEGSEFEQQQQPERHCPMCDSTFPSDQSDQVYDDHVIAHSLSDNDLSLTEQQCPVCDQSFPLYSPLFDKHVLRHFP